MKLNELLLELGNAPYTDIEVRDKDYDYMEIAAKNGKIIVYLSKIEDGRLFIEFYVDSKRNLTGTGDSFRTFSTVYEILKHHLRKFMGPDTTMVSFGADKAEPSRVKLYDRMVPYMSKLLGQNWEFKSTPYSANSIKDYSWIRKAIKENNQLNLFNSNKVYYVMINGKLWLDKVTKKPKEFIGYQEADTVVKSIIDKHGKPAQVIDPDLYPPTKKGT